MQARGELPADTTIADLPSFVHAPPELHSAPFRAFAAREAARLRPGSVRVQSSLDVALQAPAEALLRERLRDLARDGAGQGAVLVADLQPEGPAVGKERASTSRTQGSP